MSLISLRCTRTNLIMVNNLWTTLRCPSGQSNPGVCSADLLLACQSNTHRFFFSYKPDKVWGFRQTAGLRISRSTHQRTGSHWLSHLQGHQCYRGESEVCWSPHRCTHTYTQVGNYNTRFMSTRPTGGTCSSESPQEMCKTFKPRRCWAMHQMYEGIWRNCLCEYNHLVPHFMPVEDFYVRIQQRVPRVVRGGIRRNANIKVIGEKCDIVLGNGAAL